MFTVADVATLLDITRLMSVVRRTPGAEAKAAGPISLPRVRRQATSATGAQRSAAGSVLGGTNCCEVPRPVGGENREAGVSPARARRGDRGAAAHARDARPLAFGLGRRAVRC